MAGATGGSFENSGSGGTHQGGRETLYFAQVQEFRDTDEYLAAGIQTLQRIHDTIRLIKENYFFLEGSRHMRNTVLAKARSFTAKCAELRITHAKARNRYVYLASSPFSYLTEENNLHTTELWLKECEIGLMELRSKIPELERKFEGEVSEGELD